MRRRLQSERDLEPSQATIDTLETAANALALKLAGDGADCGGEFAPLQGGEPTPAMRANVQKLTDSAEHAPFGGFALATDWLDHPYGRFDDSGEAPTGCTPCAPGFHNDFLDGGRLRCSCDDQCEIPAGARDCVSISDMSLCEHYTSPCTMLPAPAGAVMNLVEAGASTHPLVLLHVAECCHVLGLAPCR